MYDAWCVVVAKQSALYVALFSGRLRKVGKMNPNRRNEPDAELSDSDSSSSSSDFHRDNLPMQMCCASPRYGRGLTEVLLWIER